MQIFLVAWIVTFACITHHSGIVFYYDRRAHKGLREFSRAGSATLLASDRDMG